MAPGVESRSLLHVVTTRGALESEELRRFGADLARHLSAMDRISGRYGGVCPATVVFTATGVGLTTSPTLAESAGYVAPEVASGADPDAASDVFALGAVLVYAATGTGPFGMGAPVELLNRTLTAEPDLGTVPRELRQTVTECLARDPRRRPGAADLATRLALPRSPADSAATPPISHPPDLHDAEPSDSPPATAAPPPETAASDVEPPVVPLDSIAAPTTSTAPLTSTFAPGPPAAPPSESVALERESPAPVVADVPEALAPPHIRSARYPGRILRIAAGVLFSVLVLAASSIFAVVHERPADATAPPTLAPARAKIATPAVSALAVSPDGRRIYVGHSKQPTVSVIDTSTDTVSALIGVPQEPRGLAVSADGAYLYVASDNAVSVIATTSDTTVAVAIGDHDTTSEAVAVSRDGATLYVADGLRPTVSVRDARTRNTTATIAVGAGNEMVEVLTLTRDGRHLFVFKTREIVVIDTSTATVTARTAFSGGGGKMVASPDGRFVYVVTGYPAAVHVLDATTAAETKQIKVDGMPSDVAVSTSGRYLFVANKSFSQGGDIVVLDAASGTVAGGLQSGIAGGQLAITPDGRRLYVAPAETEGNGVVVVDVSRYT